MSTLQPPVSSNDHSQGSADAPVTLVEYGDYQCPYCGAAYPEVKRIQERFGDDLRFVFRNFPLADMHPEAVAAASTAEYLGSQGQFWPAHDALYENQRELGWPFFSQLATDLGVDPAGLATALEQNEYVPALEASLESGLRSGVNGTPTFFINGESYQLTNSYDDLVRAIEAEIGRIKG